MWTPLHPLCCRPIATKKQAIPLDLSPAISPGFFGFFRIESRFISNSFSHERGSGDLPFSDVVGFA
jgi:hypothetical protein